MWRGQDSSQIDLPNVTLRSVPLMELPNLSLRFGNGFLEPLLIILLGWVFISVCLFGRVFINVICLVCAVSYHEFCVDADWAVA